MTHHDEQKSAQLDSATIAKSYEFHGPAIELGAVVIDDIAYPDAKVRIPLAMMNRHGLIAGATGTGKTKTLQLIAEQLSAAGVPVILADIKGDLSGLSTPGTASAKIDERAQEVGDNWTPTGFPVEFVSIGADTIGVPLRATVSSFGPLLLSKVLGLNETQESSLNLIFTWAEDNHFELYDLKDIKAVISYLVSDQGKADLSTIGGLSKQTAGVILRSITVLESNGADKFFGEPQVDVYDFLRTVDGKGIITLFELADQSANPILFSTFLMWILAQLHKVLPEVGDCDKPKLVFIFDEAHTLFHGSSKAFRANIEHTIKLIRSKGVGIFLCSQLPTDIPQEILSQLGARIQHALRAFTPEDQKALTRTVKTYPTTKFYNLSEALTSLGIGEALVTVLSEKGAPTAVAWTKMRSPRSLMADIGRSEVTRMAHNSVLWPKYSHTIDRPSAYEKLSARVSDNARTETAPASPQKNNYPEHHPAPQRRRKRKETAEEVGGFLSAVTDNPAVKTFLRSAGNSIGKEITRSIFGIGKKK